MKKQIEILENNIKCLKIRLEAMSESRQAWIERCEQLEDELKQLDCKGCSVTSKFYDYSQTIDKIFEIIKDEEEDFKLSTISKLIIELRKGIK